MLDLRLPQPRLRIGFRMYGTVWRLPLPMLRLPGGIFRVIDRVSTRHHTSENPFNYWKCFLVPAMRKKIDLIKASVRSNQPDGNKRQFINHIINESKKSTNTAVSRELEQI